VWAGQHDNPQPHAHDAREKTQSRHRIHSRGTCNLLAFVKKYRVQKMKIEMPQRTAGTSPSNLRDTRSSSRTVTPVTALFLLNFNAICP
jgi:hypothetical protein